MAGAGALAAERPGRGEAAAVALRGRVLDALGRQPARRFADELGTAGVLGAAGSAARSGQGGTGSRWAGGAGKLWFQTEPPRLNRAFLLQPAE